MDEFFEYWEILPDSSSYESIGQVDKKIYFLLTKSFKILFFSGNCSI